MGRRIERHRLQRNATTFQTTLLFWKDRISRVYCGIFSFSDLLLQYSARPEIQSAGCSGRSAHDSLQCHLERCSSRLENCTAVSAMLPNMRFHWSPCRYWRRVMIALIGASVCDLWQWLRWSKSRTIGCLNQKIIDWISLVEFEADQMHIQL